MKLKAAADLSREGLEVAWHVVIHDSVALIRLFHTVPEHRELVARLMWGCDAERTAMVLMNCPLHCQTVISRLGAIRVVGYPQTYDAVQGRSNQTAMLL